jgi:tetratricopeptide (TPR) repeat protein
VKGDLGAPDEALEDISRAISIAEEIEERTLRVQGHLRAGFLLKDNGELAAAEEQLARCSTLAAELGSSRMEALATHLLGLIKYLLGDLEEAERLGEQAGAWLERTGDTYIHIQNFIALAQYALARNDATAAEEPLREALPLALAESSWLAVDIYRYLTEALLRQGRIDDAAELVEFAARGISEEQPYVQAALKLAQGALAAAKHEAGLAHERYDEALILLEELNWPIDLSQGRIAYGRALRELGEPEKARVHLELAREACNAMGAAGLAAEVDRELALVGSRAG